jgi:hypothetical protein
MTVLEMTIAAEIVARKRNFDHGKELHAGIERGSIPFEGKNVTAHKRLYVEEMNRLDGAAPK